MVLARVPDRDGHVGRRAYAEIAGELAEIARHSGVLTVLPFALNYSAAH
jgi:hypothetical protein